MRVIPFREVLWGVANKMGLDPLQSNFHENQAVPIGDSIDQWVRRTYDAKDWPEWVVTTKVTPTNHVVSWDALSATQNVTVKIGRVIKVFLIDPNTTDAPIDTDFTLQDRGIHVGYDHGTYVWVRYMMPPPRFTAVSWLASSNYQKDDVAYSYTSGEVYRSKVNGNLNNDPASTFSVGSQNQQPPIQLPTEITQEWVPGNPGIPAQDQILEITFVDLILAIPDPPAANTVFYVEVTDEDGTVGTATEIADGVSTLGAIITAIRATFVANVDFASFTFTVNTTTHTLTIQNASRFTVSRAYWEPFTQPTRNLLVNQTQPYIPLVPSVAPVPEILVLTLTAAQVNPGAIYSLTFTVGNDALGTPHVVHYTAEDSDNAEQILNGLITEINNSTDTFFSGVICSIDTTSLTDSFSMTSAFSVDAEMVLAGSPWWELVEFPRALADMVMRGGYADLLKEWGQTDKGAMEEQAVGNEDGISTSKFSSMPDPPLTGQERGLSRYRLQS